MKRNAYFLALTVVLAFIMVFGGCKTDSGSSPTNSLPEAPTGLEAVTITENSITVTWGEVSGAELYNVYFGISADSLDLHGSTEETSYLLDDLELGTTYYIAVSAENETGEGVKSAAITVTTNQKSKPAAPSGLAAGAITGTEITITWDEVSEAEQYNVYWGTSANSLDLHGSTEETSYLLDELELGTTYYIAVSAENEMGEGVKSAVITATTIPEAPTGLEEITHTENSITVSWDAVSGAAGYNIYAGTTSGELDLMGSTTTRTIYVIQGVTSNATYYIEVSAVNPAGESEKSSAITVTTNQSVKPAAPAGLTAGETTENSIAVSWNSVGGAVGYKVFAGTSIGAMTLHGSPTGNNYVITELNANTMYYIAVSALTDSNESNQSSFIFNITKPAAPVGLAVGLPDPLYLPLTVNQWTNDSITSPTSEVWYSFTVTSGTTYYLWWNDSYEGNNSKTADIFVSASYSNGTSIFGNTDSGWTTSKFFTANQSGTVNVKVIPYSSNYGTYGIAYSTYNIRPSNSGGSSDVPTAVTSTSITVTWTRITGITYTIYAGETSDTMTQRGTTSTANTFTITGLTANTVYYIAASARNSSGESNRSSTIQVTTKLPPPTGVITTPNSGSSSIQVSWNAVIGASSYKVYRSTSETGTYTSIGTASGGSTSYNDTGLTVSTDYYYKVSAVTAGNVEGDLSASVLGRITASTKAITQFRFADFSVNGTINGTNIAVTVPNIVNLTTLAPTITHNGKSISPASGVEQNFTAPIQYTVTAEDNTTQSYTVTVSVTNTTLATAFSWINSNASSGRTYTIVAQANESLAPTTINAYSTTNIILSGGTTEKTINLSANGSLFTISTGTLTLGNNITLSGRSSNNASLVRVNSDGGLIMKTGSKIQSNTVTQNDSDSCGGGVYINGGSFTMDGGTISGNRVEATSSSSSYNNTYTRAKGGGVYLYYGTFIMNNGTISNNTAYSNKFNTAGGGVYVADNRTFTMKGGTISDNTAESSSVLATSNTYGGGVAAWSGSTFTMTGGTISGNTVKTASNQLGGGVYAKDSTFTKTGGTIYGSNASPATLQNTAKNTDSGHAVYAEVGSTKLKRNTTAGTSVNLDSTRSGSAGGWE